MRDFGWQQRAATAGQRRAVVIGQGDKLVGEVSMLVVAEACIQALDIQFIRQNLWNQLGRGGRSRNRSRKVAAIIQITSSIVPQETYLLRVLEELILLL
ncbi:hypothetical protein HRI_002642500 [Hibiscus trionum]|uniref:Uncharacterized protein n=1 Tax=Hibiscus trionum TaxID=183268 RepID=A0A9W7M4Q4_HIBTR|nr:hypothetical protein HRI_002642500 [Hibiscus trionum]